MYLDILVLAHLAHQPSHGYEIKKRVQSSIGSAALNNNVLYPALKRFQEAGAIEGELVPQPGLPPRRVYRLTETGRELLVGLLEDLPAELAQSDEEFLTRLAFFHLLAPQVRLDILAKRQVAMGGRLEHLRRMAEHTATPPAQLYALKVLEFKIAQAQTEQDWVAGLAADERQHSILNAGQ